MRTATALLVLGLLALAGCGKEKATVEVKPILTDKDREQVGRQLAALAAPVNLTLYTDARETRFSPQARQLLTEVDGMSDKVTVTHRDIAGDSAQAAADGVTLAPGLLIGSSSPSRLRFFGSPMGYEFQAMMAAIGIAAGQPTLMPETRQFLANLQTPVTIKVMSTPT